MRSGPRRATPTGSAVLLAAALVLSGCAHPRYISSYESLRAALHPGDHVEIVTAAASLSGIVATISTSSVTVVDGGTRRDIPRAAILRLQTLDRRWRHAAVVGLAVGGGTGGAIAGFSDCRLGQTSCASTRAAGIAGSALAGAGIGALVGSARRPVLIYDARSGAATP